MANYDYRGAIHCHSTYSDGTGSIDEVMKAVTTLPAPPPHPTYEKRIGGGGGR